jgi:hypothetical protein
MAQAQRRGGEELIALSRHCWRGAYLQRQSRCRLQPVLGGSFAKTNTSDQPDNEVDNAHDPTDGIGQNQDSPPQGMSTVAADTANSTQAEHGTDAYRNEKESHCPIKARFTFELAKEGAD